MVELKKVGEFEWEIPVEDGMNVPGKIFASEELIKDIKEDRSLEQVKNVAKLPGILGASLAMPDMHQGYGFPIGGVAAFDIKKGVISPGGVGYDINCSVRLLKTNLREEDLKGKEKELAHSLFRSIPSGVGRGGELKLDAKEIDEVLKGGAQCVIKKGYGFEEDWKHIEDFGKLEGADPSLVSQRAKGRGMNQLGTLGAGNHFLDVLVVDEIFDKEIAGVFGLEEGQVVIMIHCGSRGLGHQVASDYIKLMDEEYGHPEFDRELVNAPIESELGKKYLAAMAAAANFAFANKQVITHFVRKNLKHYFPDFKADVVYDICHNIAKFEKHRVETRESGVVSRELGREDRAQGEMREVLVMRKGATRAFGPGREEVCEDYRDVGQPVLLPGSMGTSSYVLVGTNDAEMKSWGSAAHGAGRVRSRSEAHKKMNFEEAVKDMEKRGVFVEAGGRKGLVEESPYSYKDVEEVVRVSDAVGLGRRVAKLRPVLVVIG
ncbi:RtcB family protein [Candidatus Pacearchaeota archaeon]|nr:RtcB family protein [Candidatus Pacearchaeota archaeon]